MSQTTIKDGMLYPILTKDRYKQCIQQGWGKRRICSKYGLTKEELTQLEKEIFLKEEGCKMATKTAVKKVNTFEKEYHEAIKQIEQLEEKNKRLHLATDNFNKEITELEEKLTGAVEKNKDQEKTINSISNDNTEMLLKLDSEYKRNQTIKSSMDSLKNENLKLKNGILKKDYEITNVNHEHAKLVDELDELVKENNALKALVKLWS